MSVFLPSLVSSDLERRNLRPDGKALFHPPARRETHFPFMEHAGVLEEYSAGNAVGPALQLVR
jgi:hypothetical protein